MNVLQICSKIPFPPTDGGTQAMHAVTSGLLKKGLQVKVLAVATHKLDLQPPDDYAKETSFEKVFIDTRVKPAGAFLNLFSGKSYNVSRFFSSCFENKLIQVLKAGAFEIVQLETLFTTPYLETIRRHSNARIVLRAHNAEFRIWERIASATSNPLKKAYLGMLARKLKKYESAMLNSYDAIAAITEADAELFKALGCKKPIEVIPFGIDPVKATAPPGGPEKNSIVHLAAMNWLPNQQGLDWFLERVWDKLSAKHPYLKLYIAGRFMPERLKQLKRENVVVTGEVPDANSFLASKNIMIVPLLSGGGMRIKIIEGMAQGKTIVSTSIGAEGIACTNGKNILIADTPEEFARAISEYLSDEEKNKTLGLEAIALAKTNYDNSAIMGKLEQLYRSVLS